MADDDVLPKMDILFEVKQNIDEIATNKTRSVYVCDSSKICLLLGEKKIIKTLSK